MMKIKNYSTLLLILVLVGCNAKPSIEGLWIVKSVSVGEEENTPNARWMRFNSDSSQQSGNGWMQHSHGTWSLKQNELRINNTNGLTDSTPPFGVSIHADKMTWKRMEEGLEVYVKLERTHTLPQTYGDKILGLWKLDQAQGNGFYFNSNPSPKDYLFIRWDKRFVIETDSNRYTGVYHVNGHRPRVSFIPNDSELPNSNWDITYKEQQIRLTQRGTDSLVTRTFSRIHEFPN